MLRASVKLKPELWRRVERHARTAGYSSAQEFIEHLLESELAKLEEQESDEQIVNKLKGLGYIE
jgi:metal-responsive CopG/Arc/MetJ family transcriptional regulator